MPDIGYKTDEDFKKINDAVDIGAIIFGVENAVLRAVDRYCKYRIVDRSGVVMYRDYTDIYLMYNAGCQRMAVQYYSIFMYLRNIL